MRIITAISKKMILIFKAKIFIQVDQGRLINYLLKNLMICFLTMELCLRKSAIENKLRDCTMISKDQVIILKEITCFIQ